MTRPIATASAPVKTSPPSAVSAAARWVSRGMTVSEMTAGARPSFTSVSAKVASSAVSTMSDAATIPMPPARAAPTTTVTTGLLSATIARCSATIARAPSSIGVVDASERSAPEQNTRPDDFSTTTRTSASWSARVEPLEQLGHELPRQRVAVVRRVQGDRRDPVGDLVVDESRSWCRPWLYLSLPAAHPPGPPHRTTPMRMRLPWLAYGVLATLAGLGLAHVVAALTDADTSPVLAVGAAVIDLTPTPMKEWAIRTFGTADKPILVGSVLAGVLVLAAVAGLLARRRTRYGAGLLVVLVAVAAIAVVTRPEASVTRPAARAWSRRSSRWSPCRGWRASRPALLTARRRDSGRRGVLIAAGVLGAARRRRRRRRPAGHQAAAPARGRDPPRPGRPGGGRCRADWTSRSPASRRSGRTTTTSTGSTPASTPPSSAATTGP